jgi:hypothetical protein
MDLLMYGIIYLFTCMLALSPRSIPSRYFFLIWLSTMILLSLSLRLNFMPDPESDMGTYAMNMAITEYILPYHAREFIFWLGSRFLYQILADPGWVFFVMDLVLFISFYHGVKLNKAFFKEYINPENIRYLLFGAFLFFPYFNGMINSYRQILAVCIGLLALGYVHSSPRKGFILLIASVFIHNVLIVLAPVIMMLRNGRFSGIITIVLSLVVFVALYISANTINPVFQKSGGVEVGQRIGLIYVFVIVFIGIFIAIFELHYRKKINTLLIRVLAYFILLYLVSNVVLPAQGAERMLFLIMAILYPMLGLYLEVAFKSGYLVRLLYTHITLAPMLYFGVM